VFIRDTQSVAPFESPHGEIVHELGGLSAGGLQQHSLAQITLPPGKSSLKHYHPIMEESYYMLSGTTRMVVDGETQTLTAGQMVAILPNQAHQIFNDGDQSAIFLAVCVPPWTPDCSIFLTE
jgi:quercetin dioxygenase-like cupin family protein